MFQTQNGEFHVKVASRPEDVKALLEVGFEYVCERDGLLFLENVNRKATLKIKIKIIPNPEKTAGVAYFHSE